MVSSEVIGLSLEVGIEPPNVERRLVRRTGIALFVIMRNKKTFEARCYEVEKVLPRSLLMVKYFYDHIIDIDRGIFSQSGGHFEFDKFRIMEKRLVPRKTKKRRDT